MIDETEFSYSVKVKKKRSEFFIEAKPVEALPDYIGQQTKALMAKLLNLETEQILANLPDEAFVLLKSQVRSENKKRESGKAKYTGKYDYDYIANKRAF